MVLQPVMAVNPLCKVMVSYIPAGNGVRQQVWPQVANCNMTKLNVAEYQARLAYQKILDADLMVDGCFFDNVMTTQSWQTTDIHGNPFPVDSNEDGVEDDPQIFDASWKISAMD
jgi:hypothetical protein